MAPAAPALKDIGTDRVYRRAVLHADLVLPDSGLMVLLWNILGRQKASRISGVNYLRELLNDGGFCESGNTLWVMPGRESARKYLAYLRQKGVWVPPDCVYCAPKYGRPIEDASLLKRVGALRVKHVVISLGGGIQEPLGDYLKRNLGYRPAIHCIGAAIGFLSGEQVRIPRWADRLCLGWLLRCVSNPRRYVPRYVSALKLLPLLWRYREKLPPLQAAGPNSDFRARCSQIRAAAGILVRLRLPGFCSAHSTPGR